MATSTVTWYQSDIRLNVWQVLSRVQFRYNADLSTITNVPIPAATGTNFSAVRYVTWAFNDDGTGLSRSISGVALSKKQNEAQTGIKFWLRNEPRVDTGDGNGLLYPPSFTPAATSDNNITAPTMYSGVGAALPLWPSATQVIFGTYAISTSSVTPWVVESTVPGLCFGLDYTFDLYGSGSNNFNETNLLRLSWNEG